MAIKWRNAVTCDGKPHTFRVGDFVGFKCDVEQYGKIVEIRDRGYAGPHVELVLENKNGFHGDYIGGQTRHWVISNECWID